MQDQSPQQEKVGFLDSGPLRAMSEAMKHGDGPHSSTTAQDDLGVLCILKQARRYAPCHLMEKKKEAQRGEVSVSRAHSQCQGREGRD